LGRARCTPGRQRLLPPLRRTLRPRHLTTLNVLGQDRGDRAAPYVRSERGERCPWLEEEGSREVNAFRPALWNATPRARDVSREVGAGLA
jgi:hypothetical protein